MMTWFRNERPQPPTFSYYYFNWYCITTTATITTTPHVPRQLFGPIFLYFFLDGLDGVFLSRHYGRV